MKRGLRTLCITALLLAVLTVSVSAEVDVREVTVSTTAELMDAIAPNTTIWLEPGIYNLTEWARDKENGAYHEYVEIWESGVYGANDNACFIHDVNNLSLAAKTAEHTEILIESPHARVLSFQRCANLTLSGLTMGHTAQIVGCSASVLCLWECEYVTLRNMDLYGCGLIGLEAFEIDGLLVEDSVIHDCVFEAVAIGDCSNAVFERCEMYFCNKPVEYAGTDVYSLLAISGATDATFNGCVFSHTNDYDVLVRNYWEWPEPTTIMFHDCVIDDVLLASLAANDWYRKADDSTLAVEKPATVTASMEGVSATITKAGEKENTRFALTFQGGCLSSVTIAEGTDITDWFTTIPAGIRAYFSGVESGKFWIELELASATEAENGIYREISCTIPNNTFFFDGEPYSHAIKVKQPFDVAIYDRIVYLDEVHISFNREQYLEQREYRSFFDAFLGAIVVDTPHTGVHGGWDGKNALCLLDLSIETNSGYRITENTAITVDHDLCFIYQICDASQWKYQYGEIANLDVALDIAMTKHQLDLAINILAATGDCVIATYAESGQMLTCDFYHDGDDRAALYCSIRDRLDTGAYNSKLIELTDFTTFAPRG